jgi:hypothetical protein
MHTRVTFDAAAGGGGGGASGGTADGPLRQLPPGALASLGGAVTAVGAGGIFGEAAAEGLLRARAEAKALQEVRAPGHGRVLCCRVGYRDTGAKGRPGTRADLFL